MLQLVQAGYSLVNFVNTFIPLNWVCNILSWSQGGEIYSYVKPALCECELEEIDFFLITDMSVVLDVYL